MHDSNLYSRGGPLGAVAWGGGFSKREGLPTGGEAPAPRGVTDAGGVLVRTGCCNKHTDRVAYERQKFISHGLGD